MAKEKIESFSAEIAAIAMLATYRLAGYFMDENDNEAMRNPDGTVRLSIKQKGGGHRRVTVKVPSAIALTVIPEAKPVKETEQAKPDAIEEEEIDEELEQGEETEETKGTQETKDTHVTEVTGVTEK